MNDPYSENIYLSSGKGQEGREYWINKLGSSIEMTGFPSDSRDLPSAGQSAEEIYLGSIPPDLSERIRGICGQSAPGIYSLLLSGVMYVLQRYSGEEQLIVGMPLDKKTEAGGSSTRLLLPVKMDMDERWSFKQLLNHVNRTVQEAHKHRHIPLHQIMRVIPHFKTVVSLDSLHASISLEGTQADMIFHFMLDNNGLELKLHYDRGIYSLRYVEGIFLHYVRLLEEVLRDADTALQNIPMMSPAEVHQLLVDFNATSVPYWSDKVIHELLELQAVKCPDQAAIWFKNTGLTYRELNDQSDRLAVLLRNKGIGRNSIAAVMMNRSLGMIVAMIAILKAGGAYLPIDPGYPQERINYMLEDSRTELLLIQSGLESKVDFYGETLILDETLQLPDHVSLPRNENVPEDPAYLIYTSGSTGKPKGVLVPHRSVVNFIKGMTDRIAFTAGKSIAAVTTFSFDIFVLETILPLTQGLVVFLASEEEQNQSSLLRNWLATHDIQMLQTTPSRFQLLLNEKEGAAELTGLSDIMVGGEPFANELLHQLQTKFRSANIYNMYGPTETTVWSTVKDVTAANCVNLGTPIANTRIYIVDKALRLVPVGVEGELCIAGDGVALGYWKRDELTAEKFVHCPFTDSGKMYRTGDLAKWLPDGEIQFLGRIDQQVKVRGHRIELGEIESALLKMEFIDAAVCIAKEDGQGNKFICAYYVSPQELSADTLRNYMASSLPDYMLPSFYIPLPELPYTPNGKVDRKILPDPYFIESGLFVCEPPADEMEERLLSIWKRVLEVEHIGVTDDFFNSGGHSLKALKLEVELEKAGIALSSEDIYRYPTVREASKRLREGEHSYVPSAHPSLAKVKPLELEGATMVSDEKLIEPFNKLFYKECFYNSLFPVVGYYRKSILPILMNDTIAYSYDPTSNHFKVEYREAKPIHQLLLEQGIEMEEKAVSHSVIEDLQMSIRGSKPVILRVDCFYASKRSDTYHKKHWPHSWLVFGFDDARKLFCVIEHDNIENLTYQKRWVSYDDTVQCYNGYLSHFGSEKMTYYAFSEHIGSSLSAAFTSAMDKDQLISSLMQNERLIYTGLEQLNMFTEVIKGALADARLMQDYSSDLLDALNQIVNGKIVEKYRFEQLSDRAEDWRGMVDESLSIWKAIRAKTAKSVFASRLPPKTKEWLSEQLDLAVAREYQYYDKLYASLNKIKNSIVR